MSAHSPLPLLLLNACAQFHNPDAGQPELETATSKSVDSIVQCLTDEGTNKHDAQFKKTPIPQGTMLEFGDSNVIKVRFDNGETSYRFYPGERHVSNLWLEGASKKCALSDPGDHSRRIGRAGLTVRSTKAIHAVERLKDALRQYALRGREPERRPVLSRGPFRGRRTETVRPRSRWMYSWIRERDETGKTAPRQQARPGNWTSRSSAAASAASGFQAIDFHQTSNFTPCARGSSRL